MQRVPRVPVPVSKVYDSHRSTVSSWQCALNVLLVSVDCVLAGFQVKDASILHFVGFGHFVSKCQVLHRDCCLDCRTDGCDYCKSVQIEYLTFFTYDLLVVEHKTS
jgi:hypothetical protein